MNDGSRPHPADANLTLARTTRIASVDAPIPCSMPISMQTSWSTRGGRKLQLQLTAENLLDDRITVRDRDGATPDRFRSAYRDPLGHSIRIGLRKLS